MGPMVDSSIYFMCFSSNLLFLRKTILMKIRSLAMLDTLLLPIEKKVKQTYLKIKCWLKKNIYHLTNLLVVN